MKTAADYLDAIRARHQLNSDRKAAAMLGVSSPSVVRFRKGEDSFSDATAAKVADLLDCDPEEVMIAAHAERAKDDRTRALWARLAKKAGYTAGIVAMAAGLAGSPAPAQAAGPSNAATICIM